MTLNPLEVEELRLLIQDLHAALKDGDTLLKRMEKTKAELTTVAEEVFKERIDQQVSKGLEKYQTTLLNAVDEGVEAVYARFDKLTNLLLTGNVKGKGEDIEELIRKKLQEDATLRGMLDL